MVRDKLESEMFVASRLRESAKWIELAYEVIRNESYVSDAVSIGQVLTKFGISYDLVDKLIETARELEAR